MRGRIAIAGLVAAPFLFLGLVWMLVREPAAPSPSPWVHDPAPPTPPSSAPPAAMGDEALVLAKCGNCHPPVNPGVLSREDWGRTMFYMRWLLPFKAGYSLPEAEMDRIHAFYVRSSPEALPILPPDPSDTPLKFERQAIGAAAGPTPRIANVQIVDLFGEGRPGVLACDVEQGAVTFLRRDKDGTWTETVLAKTGPPAHAEVIDFDRDGRLDLVVAVLGSAEPTEEKVGKVLLLRNAGEGRFEARTILEGVGRVSDARPADLNGDGRIDVAVAVFGYLKEGRIGWLEQKAGGDFAWHTLLEKPGAIHVPVADLNGDGKPEILALVSQDQEEILAFVNEGKGDFEARSLFKAGTPVFGSSGMQLVDLDGDGDLDVLFTNGDSFDLPQPGPYTRLRPYHGVQWLENQGGLRFVHRDLYRFYGAYATAVADLNGDGFKDIVLVSMYSSWEDPERGSIFWLENDGRQNFRPHLVDRSPTELATVAAGDLDGDGRPDVVAGVFHLSYPLARKGRVTFWRNPGK